MRLLAFLQTDPLKLVTNFCNFSEMELSSLNLKHCNEKGWGHRNQTVARKVSLLSPNAVLHELVQLIIPITQAPRVAFSWNVQAPERTQIFFFFLKKMNLPVKFSDSSSTFASLALIPIPRFMWAWYFPWMQGPLQNNFLKTEIFLEFSGPFQPSF